MKNSVRLFGKLVDFYEENHQEFYLEDDELLGFKDEAIDELNFIIYQLQYSENKEEEVSLKIIELTDNDLSNLASNADS